ncbi:hypothetical protein HYS50_02885 [Candidatus Woesearchaeota archaeon]|nr:hypothetical protein [Candidatus Woesearchaeota archaeon]
MIDISSRQQKTSRNSLLFPLVVLTLLLFGIFTYPFLSYWANIISGAETASGTVSITILGRAGEVGEEVIKPKVRERGKLISLELEVIPDEIVARVERYQGKIISLLLRNRGDKTFNLVLSSTVSALKVTEKNVVLAPGEEKRVVLIVDTSKLGIFVGLLKIEGLFAFKQLPVFIHILEPGAYQVRVTIPPAVKKILPGQPLFADITVESLLVDNLTLSYLIKDSADQIVVQEEEQTYAQQKTLAFRKTFALPENLALGDYFLLVEAVQPDQRAAGGDLFSVVESLEERQEFPARLYRESPLVFFLIILAILVLHIIMTRSKKH